MKKVLLLTLFLSLLSVSVNAQERIGAEKSNQAVKADRVVKDIGKRDIKSENKVIKNVVGKTVSKAVDVKPIKVTPIRPAKPITPVGPGSGNTNGGDTSNGGNASGAGNEVTNKTRAPNIIYNNSGLAKSGSQNYIKTTLSNGLKSKRVRKFLINKITKNKLAPETFPKSIGNSISLSSDVERVFAIIKASEFKLDQGDYIEFYTEVPEDYEILIAADNEMTDAELADLATAAGGEVVEIEDFDDRGTLFIQLPGQKPLSVKKDSDGSINIQD